MLLDSLWAKQDEMNVLLCFAVVSCYRPPWLMLIKPRRRYFRGKHPGVGALVSSCFDSYFREHLFISRVTSSLQRQLVMADFTPEFRQKIQDFYRQFLLPIELKNLRNRCVCLRAHEEQLCLQCHLANQLKL